MFRRAHNVDLGALGMLNRSAMVRSYARLSNSAPHRTLATLLLRVAAVDYVEIPTNDAGTSHPSSTAARFRHPRRLVDARGRGITAASTAASPEEKGVYGPERRRSTKIG